MVDLSGRIKPHYSEENESPKISKIDNLNKGAISEMVEIIKENKKLLGELAKKDENLHK